MIYVFIYKQKGVCSHEWTPYGYKPQQASVII